MLDTTKQLHSLTHSLTQANVERAHIFQRSQFFSEYIHVLVTYVLLLNLITV